MFIVLLSDINNKSNYTKCLLLNSQKCMTQPTVINVHSREDSQ